MCSKDPHGMAKSLVKRRDWTEADMLVCSIWVFLLLGAESIKTYRANPYFEYVPLREGGRTTCVLTRL